MKDKINAISAEIEAIASEAVLPELTAGQIIFIKHMLFLSVVLFGALVLWLTVPWIYTKCKGKRLHKSGVSSLLIKTIPIMLSICILRYTVGYYQIVTDKSSLNYFEEIANSFVHALQTFSMDEDYTQYIVNGKEMMQAVYGVNTWGDTFYGVLASLLNLVAPVIGGALIFEILASIFPRISLFFGRYNPFKKKFYFSELNDASLATMKSLQCKMRNCFWKPVMIFTDAYADRDNEKSSELLMSAASYGAICIKDDINHAPKRCWGEKQFFLIDENESGNLNALSNLANDSNCKFLKNAKVYLFSQSDAYVQVESSVRNILYNEKGYKEEMPMIIPVKRYRNLISNLLSKEVPLYEPLVNKAKEADGSHSLNVTVLGTGLIGVEMFLSTYWFGQMLDVKTTVNVISKESEEEFWDKIDSVNPEIRRTTRENDCLLRYNSRGGHNAPYCSVNYIQSDVCSSEFVNLMNKNGEKAISEADYIFIALGTDEININTANSVLKQVGKQHIAKQTVRKTAIVYVVYDSALSKVLNVKKRYCFADKDTVDVYMRAIGCTDELYSYQNIVMDDYEEKCKQVYENYKANHGATEDEAELEFYYSYWANLAREMHLKYKAFSAGEITESLFTSEGEKYREATEKAVENYRRHILDKPENKSAKEYIELQHRLSWLEHRRWTAFSRIRGFKSVDFETCRSYSGLTGNHKNFALKLHPCILECDDKGMRKDLLGTGKLSTDGYYCDADPKTDRDFLDELSVYVRDNGIKRDTVGKDGKIQKAGYSDFKKYDYPSHDFKFYTKKEACEKCGVTEQWLDRKHAKGLLEYWVDEVDGKETVRIPQNQSVLKKAKGKKDRSKSK